MGKDEDRWYGSFKPILGLIAVAQGAGLTDVQLAAISGKEVEQPLRICKQYLDGELPEGPFRPFHKSFADFLLEDDKNTDYHIDDTDMHRRIADWYWQAHHPDGWQKCDDYGLTHLATHLVALRDDPKYGAKYREQLYQVICPQFMRAKRFRTRSDTAFAADVEKALETAATEVPVNWVQLVRDSLVYATLGSLATNIPPEILGPWLQPARWNVPSHMAL